MTELKTHVNNENGTYEVTMVTDKKENYQLMQYLIRGFIDDKQCSVTVTDRLDPEVAYVNSGCSCTCGGNCSCKENAVAK